MFHGLCICVWTQPSAAILKQLTIEVPFGMWTLVDPRNHVLVGGSVMPQVRVRILWNTMAWLACGNILNILKVICKVAVSELNVSH